MTGRRTTYVTTDGHRCRMRDYGLSGCAQGAVEVLASDRFTLMDDGQGGEVFGLLDPVSGEFAPIEMVMHVDLTEGE